MRNPPECCRKRIDAWALTSLQQRLEKKNRNMIKHARYYLREASTFLLSELDESVDLPDFPLILKRISGPNMNHGDS
jgi:hypothetical protein